MLFFRTGLERMGQAALAARLNLYVHSDEDHDLLNTFAVLGDPALRIAVAAFMPTATAARTATPTSTATATATPTVTASPRLAHTPTRTPTVTASPGLAYTPTVGPTPKYCVFLPYLLRDRLTPDSIR